MAEHEYTSVRDFLREQIPAGEIQKTALRLGAVKRRRKVDIVELICTVVVMVCGRGGQSLAAMRRQLASQYGVKLARSAFWKRFTPGFEHLVSWLLGRLQRRACADRPVYTGLLRGFKDVVAVDATVIKVHDSLAKVWRGTRSTRKAALKIHTMVRAITGELLRHKITPEAHGDGRELKIGHWAKGMLFLYDRAYRSASLWWRVHRVGGYFVTRLPASYKPTIKAVNRRHRGRARDLKGQRLHEAIRGLKRSVIDVTCDFSVRVRAYNAARGRRFQQEFRVVAIWQKKHRRYLLFVTNLPVAAYSPNDVAELYRLRWEVETFYKTGKSGLGLNELPSRKPHVVRTLVKAALIRACIAMRARTHAERRLPATRWINPGQWVHVWRELIVPLISGHLRDRLTWDFLAGLALDPNRKRPPTRRTCMLVGDAGG